MTSRPAKRRLRLESLEVRALLAGDVGSDLAKAMAAVQGSAPIDGSLDPLSLNHLFELTGHGSEALIIDLDRLPSFVTKLSLSNFASVTMIGTDSVQYLIARDVQSLVAPNLSIEAGVHLHNIGAVELASGGQLALLTGTNTEFSVRSLEHTTIYSLLEILTLQSESKILNVESWNPNQIIQVKSHPDLIAVSGIDSPSAVRFVDSSTPTVTDPITDGGTNNGITIPSNPGNEVGVPDTPVVVIVNQLDERTRAFIAELRESLRLSSKDSQRLVIEFLNHSAPYANPAGATPTNPLRPVIHANPRELEAALQRAPIAIDGEFDAVATSGATNGVVAADRPVFDQYTDQPIELSQMTLPFTAELGRPMEIDATWPVAVTTQKPAEETNLFVPLGLGQPEPEQPKLEDSIRAFTDYVVERVTAEFSPGQQSLVLLVDPKPNRPVGVSKGSALDVFGSSTNASIATLRQAMS